MGWRSISISIRAVLLMAALALPPARAIAQDIGADATIETANGYARLVFLFTEATDADVRISNNILVISFRNPVDVSVDQFAGTNDYISAARRDPDGKGVRLALSRKVRLNSMIAGERLFVDLLPDSWTGAPPPLPRDVVEDLARRTREAEKRIQQAQQQQKPRAQALSRVRVSRQPTFTRYIFELPEYVAITTDRTRDKLKLVFDAPVKFDLADAKVMQPPTVSAIETSTMQATASVAMALVGQVDVRSFREDNNFIVDIVTGEAPRPDDNRLPPTVPPVEIPAGRGAADMSSLPVRKSAVPPPPVAKAGPVEAEAAKPALPKPEIAKVAVTEPEADKTDRRSDAQVPTGKRTAAPADPAAQTTSGSGKMTMERRGDGALITFPFTAATPAAAFVRADVLWLVFETKEPVALAPVSNEVVREASVTRQGDVQLVRIRLERPRLVSLSADGNGWTVNIADSIVAPSSPIIVMRNVVNELRRSASIPFDDPRGLHRIEDPDVGDTLLVVTGLGPARGVPKNQDFVDFRALASVQGIVVQPKADDLSIELSADRVMIARPGGLTLTSSLPGGRRGSPLQPSMFDTQQWGFDRQAPFLSRQAQLIDAAAKAPEDKRDAARFELARFYFARDMYAEAKGVLDVVLEDRHPNAEDDAALAMRGVANLLMGRNAEGLKDLNSQAAGPQNDAALWRALAAAHEGKWAEARDGFRKSEIAISLLPLELQRELGREIVRSAINVGDFGAAAAKLAEFETLRAPAGMQPSLAVLAGRIQEGLGRNVEALASYRSAADSADRASAAQGRLREIALRYRLGDLKRADVTTALETLTASWRGDETEVESLQLLARLYTEEARYRDAFNAMRTAFNVLPDSSVTRSIQEDAAATFNALFLGAKGDTLPAIEALSLFYDFRELTPIGRKGDEMIRRLADRLVAVDLLDQAAELLQHQVDHRLQGAARAQVATRLAVIYLMNRKPDRALGVLRATRTGELPSDLRNQRLLIEARALAGTGRYNLALEVIENVSTPEAMRTRSDLMWNAKHYREAAEQIEVLYGDRWRNWTPLNDIERHDILRAALGYNLAGDGIGLGRFKEKFSPAMMQGPDRRAFEVAIAPLDESSDEFKAVVRTVSSTDTLGRYLRDIGSGGPEAAVTSKARKIGARPQPDFTPTGAIAAAGATVPN